MFKATRLARLLPMIDAILLAKLDRAVPRYTSYPTAPHFSPNVATAAQASWLAAIPQDSPLSLYLHVPFCDQLCFFCGCNTAVRDGQCRRLCSSSRKLVAEASVRVTDGSAEVGFSFAPTL